jgi:hypothetical protein
MNNRFLRNYFIYLLIFIGYFLLYVYQVEKLVYGAEGGEMKSKINFVYQQF